MRNSVRDDVRRVITLLQRSNISPRCRQAASSGVCVLLRCTIVRTLYYFTAESWELLYTIVSCPVAIFCEKRVFCKNFKNHNHSLIKTYKLFYFCNVQLYNALTTHSTVYRYYWNKCSKLEKLVRNTYMKVRIYAFTWACKWENWIVTDAKLSKRDCDFYYLILNFEMALLIFCVQYPK